MTVKVELGERQVSCIAVAGQLGIILAAASLQEVLKTPKRLTEMF